ncbi:MAG: Gfo/Idh/MocA family oxidoreductase [Deinococcales bacterium]
MQNPVRIGVVGFNKGGRYFHAPLIDAAKGCEVAAIVARSADRVAAAKKDYPDKPVFASISEMAKADVIDALVISTPLDTHLALARESLAFGLPTIIDKPFAPNASLARLLLEEAQAQKVLLSVYQNRRWDADYLTVKKLIASGQLGDIWLYESRMEQYCPPDGVPDSGGGVLLDFGSHVFDQTLHLLGPAEQIYAEVHPIPGREPLEDRFFASVLHKNGVRSHLTGDFNLQGSPAPRFRVTGSKGTFAIASDDGLTAVLLEGGRLASHPDRWGKVSERNWGRLESPEKSQVIASEDGAWPNYYEQFALAVRGLGPLPVDPWDSLAALSLLDAALQSVKTGQVIKL